MTSDATPLARVILRHNLALLGLVLVLFLGLAFGIVWLRFSSSNSDFFGSTNPDLLRIQQIEDAYAGASGIIIMLAPPEGLEFAPETLEMVQRVAEEAWFTPYVLRVDAATGYVHSRGEGDEIFVEPLLPEGVPVTPEAAQRFAGIAPGAAQVVNRLMARDGSAYGVSVDIVLPEGADDAARAEVRDFLRAKRAEWQAAYPGTEIRLTGAALGGLTLSQAARDDVVTLVPLAFMSAVLILIFFLRSARAVIFSTMVVALGTVATFGIAGWFGIELTAGTAISPLAVMVLTSASCVHVVLAWARALERGDGEAATRHALAMNLAPVTVATVTTAIGFLGMNFADSPPLREMGNVVALGLLFAMLLVFFLLPFGLRRGRDRGLARRLPLSRARMLRLGDWIWRRQVVWLILFPVTILISVFGITRIGFDDNMLRYFSEAYEFRRDTDAIQDRLTGLDTLTFSFTAPEEAGVFDPGFLRDIDRFSGWLREQDVVVSTLDIADIVKRMNRAMSADDPAQARIADTREENAQLMMFYELSLPVGLDLNAQIDVDRLQTRVTAFIRADHSHRIRDLADAAEAWLAANTPDTIAPASGYSIAFARITERNNKQMLMGLLLVLALVSLILMATLRSVRFGLISLVPNLVPAIMAFGAWGVTKGDVNLGSTVVTTMTFGIVVDDTVHFLTHFLRRRRLGDSVRQAHDHTFTTVGASIMITSFALIAGFAIMATSGFAINQHMGALTAIVIVFALLADLLLLPSVLRLCEKETRCDT